MAVGSRGKFVAFVALACVAVGGTTYGVARLRLRAQTLRDASAASGEGGANGANGVEASPDAGASAFAAGGSASALASTGLGLEAGVGGGPIDSGFEGYTVDGEDAGPTDAQSQIDVEYLTSLVPLEPRTPEAIGYVKKLLAERRINISQGNPKAVHEHSRAQCLEGLKGQILQSPKQREICGHENEVPVYADGDIDGAKVCIDQFEYPNHACNLPFVFSNPINSEKLCEMAGKRLCKDVEWDTACDADPGGGKPTQYAYGDELDMKACNVGKLWLSCLPNKDIWGTCPTESEPSGAFPKCKSRLGVYDQHGNIAEFMSRLDPNDHVVYAQMKGSAWFYDGKMYKDHCRFDPRWHVDPINASWHANYHLGARCCRDVVPLKDRGKASATPASPADGGLSDATTSDAKSDASK